MILKLILIFLFLFFLFFHFVCLFRKNKLEQIKEKYRLTKFRKCSVKEISFDDFIRCIVNKREYDQLYNMLIKYVDEVDIANYIFEEYFLHKKLWQDGISDSSSDKNF